MAKEHLTGFDHEPETAIRTYFDYYKIDARDALLPWDKLSSPLFLSLFCQATNPERKAAVGVDRIPRSLTAVFEAYRAVVVSRAATVLRMADQDVESALERFSLALWEQDTRAFDFDELRRLVGDAPRAWESSLARVLEEEGVLSRDPYPAFGRFDPDGHSTSNQVSAILYDAFAGFLIADAILTQQGFAHFESWVSANCHRLDLTQPGHHPFAEDILNGLIGLLPRRFHRQLWTYLPSPLREVALLETTNLEPERVDQQTRSELIDLCKKSRANETRDAFLRLWSTRASPNHPLNAEFLGEVLRGMDVADRDLRWTEWVRQNRKDIVKDLERLKDQWRRSSERGASDHLRARWTGWTLTSTVRYLRDEATEALYWYGIGAPRTFFEMAIEALDVNDPYIPERMLAAAYGIVMGFQRAPDALRGPLSGFLEEIAKRLTGDGAGAATNHWMIRVYVQGIVDFARRFLPDVVPPVAIDSEGRVTFARGAYVNAPSVTQQHPGYLGHDFENYQVGRLFNDRSNYDYEHEVFNAAVTEIRGRVWQLGYREAEFKAIDAAIRDSYTHRNEPSRTERYAKKYGWIGFYEKAGALVDTGSLTCKPRCGRGNPIVDIDPSFPRVPQSLSIAVPDWVAHSSDDNKEWLRSGNVVVPNELLRATAIGDKDGPWIAVDGFLQRTDKLLRRQTFGFIRGMLAAENDVEKVVALLKSKDYLGNSFIPDEPSSIYTYAGEIPWSDEFASDDDYDELGPYKRQLGGHWGEGPMVELLSHRYDWESHHSALNRAGGYSVPSKAFSSECDLRSAPSSFDQFDADGAPATISLSPPESFDRVGNILYIREDLLRKFATARKAQLVWVVWGERNVTIAGFEHPDWAREIYQRNGHLWRRIVTLADIAGKR